MTNPKPKIIIIAFTLLALLAAGFFVFQNFRPAKNQTVPGGPVATLSTIILPKNYDEEFKLSRQDFSLSIKAANAKSVAKITPTQYVDALGNPIPQGAEVARYNGAYDSVDVEVVKLPNKIKESLILKGEAHPDSFAYQLNLDFFAYQFDAQGNLDFYPKGKIASLLKLFTIPKPFMVDANGEKSSNVKMEIKNNLLILTPDKNWLAAHQYPIILDPTVQIRIINAYSQPQLNENWKIHFVTSGAADLLIEPQDQATIADDELIGLTCDGKIIEPKILAGDKIFVKNWECPGRALVVHKTLKAGEHNLKFTFGDQTAFAYNGPHDSVDLLVKAEANYKENALASERSRWSDEDKEKFEQRSTVGDIVAVRPTGWEWGAEERPPKYVVITITGLTYQEALYLQTPLEDESPGQIVSKLIKIRKYSVPPGLVTQALNAGGRLELDNAGLLNQLTEKKK